ncbi:hypothetical protein K4H02_26280, partial [Mycobacterium tuberculosis]|nr:hypothetical protein [Mycobacterium tuberculosis]
MRKEKTAHRRERALLFFFSFILCFSFSDSNHFSFQHSVINNYFPLCHFYNDKISIAGCVWEMDTESTASPSAAS